MKRSAATLPISRTRSPRIAQRQVEKRERLVQAAMELFVEKGVEATTVADIAKKADVGKGTFFSYFPTKQAVFSELSRMLVERMIEPLALGAPSGDTETRLLEFVLPACEWHQANPELSRLLIEELQTVSGVLGGEDPVLDVLVVWLTTILREERDRGALAPGVDPEDAAMVLFGAYFSALRRWHQGGAKADLPAMVRAGVRLVVRGLGA